MKFKHYAMISATALALTGCSVEQGSPQVVGRPVVVDPSPDTCVVYLIKDNKIEPVQRADEKCLSSQEAVQQLLLGPEDEEARHQYTTQIPALVNEFPRIHYQFRNNQKTVMQLPISLKDITDLGMQQISCTITKTHDGLNLVIEGKEGRVKDLVACPVN